MSVSAPTISSASPALPPQRTSENSVNGHHQVNSGIPAIHSDDELGFSVQSQAFMDKSLTAGILRLFLFPFVLIACLFAIAHPQKWSQSFCVFQTGPCRQRKTEKMRLQSHPPMI